MRYSIKLSYLGSAFCGWQRQPSDPSVQECLEDALGRLLGVETPVIGAGRTDTGVNAIGYVACFDGPDGLAAVDFIYKLNAILPRSVVVNDLSVAEDDFHARFGAVRREYTYFLHRCKDPFVEMTSWQCGYPELDFEAMNAAAAALLGTHDFSCFEKKGADNKTSICTVFEARWTPYIPTHVQIMPGAFPSGIIPAPVTADSSAGTAGSSAVTADSSAVIAGSSSVIAGSSSVIAGSSAVIADSSAVIAGSSAVIAGPTGNPSATGKGPVGDPQGADHTSIARPSTCTPQYWYFRISADRFLRNMVRAIVGTLIEVGRAKRTPTDFATLILPPDTPSVIAGPTISPSTIAGPTGNPAATNTPAATGNPTATPNRRALAGESVPGHALFLSKVEY